ncbi:MAG TPA: prepilin-type N-terminal cleavage/methylation domain-containing protein [Gammaproteobacteria bacterium]|nr:prepilin-type N-terminal cleavage/methylation domain-containing protein [Gammaproteobacteria bacterium]
MKKHQGGFTLVELVTVVVLIGILAALGGFMILTPFTSFTDQARRAELTDIADNALQRITREVRQALPNSVRTGPGGTALEFLNTIAGGRYRARVDTPGNTGDPLVNCNPGETFDALGGGIGSSAIGKMLVIYNTGTTAADFNAYRGNNTATITNVVGDLVTCDSGNFSFTIPPSSLQRFFVVDTPISYVCSGGSLWRYQNYAIDQNQPVPAGGLDIGGVLPSLLADQISFCEFSYSANVEGGRYGLLTMRITVTAAGESVALLYQAHVANIP